jgi:hypothetical protein
MLKKARPWAAELGSEAGKRRKWELKQSEKHGNCNGGMEGNEDRKGI